MSKRLTLEQRIARLERLLKNEARARKFESYESDLDEMGAERDALKIAKQFCEKIGVDSSTLKLIDKGDLVINSPANGWVTVDQYELDQQDPETEDPDARFGFEYYLGRTGYTITVYPTDNAVCLMTADGGLYIDTDGIQFTDDNGNIVAYPLSEWDGFNLSMVDDEGDGYNVEAGDDFRSYRGMLRKHESRQSVVSRIARLEKLLSRKSR